jgi:metal-sulfur cluster biosynthetic enzyme
MRTLLRRLGSWWNKEPQQQPVIVPPPAVPVATPMSAPSPSPIRPAELNLDTATLSEALVYQALRNCKDPEIPVNIVDLGLIYDVRVAEDLVQVKMTLTTQGCGMGGYISQEAEEQIRALPGVRTANVEIVWDPPWDPSMISPEGKKTLGLPE